MGYKNGSWISSMFEVCNIFFFLAWALPVSSSPGVQISHRRDRISAWKRRARAWAIGFTTFDQFWWFCHIYILQKRYKYIYIIVGLLSMRLSAFAYSDGPATFRFVPKSFYYLISCCKMQLWILSNNIFQLKHEARNSKFRSQPQKLKRMTARKARIPNRHKL